MSHNDVSAPCFLNWDCRQFRELITQARAAGRALVVCNGVFDLLHAGHLEVFETGRRAAADAFVVAALASDVVARRLKGPDRPFVRLRQRLALVAALRCVDAAAGTHQDTPVDLISFVRPDYLVKGTEYRGTEVPGADLARKGLLWSPMSGPHTSEVARRIRKASDLPA